MYEVGVSRGCSEWLGVGAPGHSLAEPLCRAAQQLRATESERASGRGRYVGGGWLRTPLLEFKAIRVQEPSAVAGN